MNSKLTLRLDEDLIQSAKSYSAKTGKSVSKIVADYFALIDKKLSGRQREISPLTRSLRGSLKKGKVSEEDYKKYLELSLMSCLTANRFPHLLLLYFHGLRQESSLAF